MEGRKKECVTAQELKNQEQLLLETLKNIKSKLGIISNNQVIFLVKTWIEKYPSELILHSIDIAGIKKVHNINYVQEVLVNLCSQKNQSQYL